MFLLINNSKFFAYWMVMLLVLSSGNSCFKVYGTYFYMIMAGIVLFDLFRSRQLVMSFDKLWRYILIMISIFVAQYIVFGWNTFPGIINFLSKIVFGAFIVVALDYRFRYYYLKVMYHLSVISIVFFSLQIFYGCIFDLIPVGKVGKSILFYFSHNRAFDRNCGAFWEPGAYGCYLMFVPLLFINNLTLLYKRYKKECIILFIALLTTQSTTAFLSFAMLIAMFLLFQLKSYIKYVYLVLFCVGYIYLYDNTSFLAEKIEIQNQSAIASDGAFNSTRLGSFLFDLHYLKKHPLIGNGLHGRTRYADHPNLVSQWQNEELAKSGNSFSDYLAKMGIIFYLTFFLFFRGTNNRVEPKNITIFFIIFTMLLFGEPLLNYPFALALPFININHHNQKFYMGQP